MCLIKANQDVSQFFLPANGRHSFFHSRIYQPLGMTRTGTHAYSDDGKNLAKTYEALDDASVAEVVPMLSGDDTVGGPGSAMRSCIRDLVQL